jgi:hypothetical protein
LAGTLLFEIETPLGFSVRCTREYWQFIVSIKHPSMAGHEEAIRGTLADPDEVRRSRKDRKVFLFYRGKSPRWICDEVVVMKDRKGRIIGFELLHYKPANPGRGLAVETLIRSEP